MNGGFLAIIFAVSIGQVSGFDFHGKNGGTAFTDVIYVYVEAGIIRITGDEAVALHEQMKGKFKQL
jgi:hypothetical protein